MSAAGSSESMRAAEYNRKELRHAFRQFWTRMAILTVFGVVALIAVASGLGTSQNDVSLWVITCCALLCVLFLILALDSWGCIREIKGRRWASLTPRFSSSATTQSEGAVAPQA